MDRDRQRKWALVSLTIVALPAAWVVEQLLVRFVLPSDLRLVQEHFAEPLQPVGWILVGATAFVGVFSWVAHSRALKRLREAVKDGAEPRPMARREVGLFLWYASLPQIPALGATVGTLVGISLLHSVLAVALSTVAIAAIGMRT